MKSEQANHPTSNTVMPESNVPDTVIPISQHVSRAMLLAKSTGSEHVNILPTGYTELDRLTYGFHRGCISVLSGNNLSCKTVLAMNIVEPLAMARDEKPASVLVFSTKESGCYYAKGIICRAAGIHKSDLNGISLNFEDELNLVHALGRIRESPLFIDDSVSLNVTELCERTRVLHSRLQKEKNEGLSLIMIDDLQMVSASDQCASKGKASQIIMHEIKQLAETLNVAVLAISRLKRGSIMSNRPVFQNDIKWHKALERYADLIMILRKTEDHKDSKNTGTLHYQLVLTKNRNGPIGAVDLALIRKNRRFVDYSYQD